VVRIASYNVENLFARPKAFRTADPDAGASKLRAYERVNALFKKAAHPAQDKADMKSRLIELDRRSTTPRCSSISTSDRLSEAERPQPHTDRLTGKVAIQITVPRNNAEPSPRMTARGVAARRRVLMPAKNRAAANSTTASE
jgi:hypothetical protein